MLENYCIVIILLQGIVSSCWRQHYRPAGQVRTQAPVYSFFLSAEATKNLAKPLAVSVIVTVAVDDKNKGPSI